MRFSMNSYIGDFLVVIGVAAPRTVKDSSHAGHGSGHGGVI